MNRRQLISTLLAAALCAGTVPAALAAQSGIPPAAASSADMAAGRRADLDTLIGTLERVHPNLYANTPKADFAAKQADIASKLDAMSDFDFAIAVSELVALVRDSHTGANIGAFGEALRFLPFDVAWMDEGWVFVSLTRDQADCLGGTLTAINGIPISDVQARVSPMIGSDNDTYARRQFGGLLYVYEILEHYGVAQDPNHIALTVRLQDGSTCELTVAAQTRAQMQQLDVVSLAAQRTGAPATAADKSKTYFMKPLDSRTLYIQYNACREDKDLPMETFTGQVKTEIEQNSYDRAIVDLRNNGGGSDGVLVPLIHLLEEKHEQDGMAFYTLIGEATFSSALINAVELKEAGATLVGTPTGGSVDHFGSVSSFNLPNSGIRIGYSTKFIDLGSILDAAKPYSVESLPPDLLAAQTLRDYLAGKDTAVEAILSRTRDTAPAKLVLTRGALAAALGRAYAAETGETLNLEQPTFSDVSMFSYLAPYVVWAQKNGILYGETASCFAPDRAVTRQELAAVLSRYAAFRGRPFPAAGTCSPTDAASIAPWAVDAARSLAEAGVLPLKNGAFQPRGTVARADWAGIFARLP